MTAQIIPISDSSLPLATSVGPNDLLLMNQVDGTQITGYKTKRVKTSLVANTPNTTLEYYGGAADGTTDNTTAFAALIAAFSGKPIFINLNAGTYYFASTQSLTLASGQSIAIKGQGQDITVLKFANAGLNIAYTNLTNTCHFADLTMATMSNSGTTAIGVNLTQNTASYALGYAPQSDFTNVTLRGSDGIGVTNYWYIGIQLNDVSYCNFQNVNMFGPNSGSYSTVGLGVVLNGTATFPPVEFDFSCCSFNLLQAGIYYGNYAQGVSASQCNFTGCNYGIYVPPTLSNLDELIAIGCQFNCATNGIFIGSSVPNTMVSSCLFIVPANAQGLYLSIAGLSSIVGNTFNSATGTPATNIGIVVGSFIAPCAITGNAPVQLATGIFLMAASQSVNVQGNVFIANTNAIVNSGTNNITSNNLGYNSVGAASVTTSASPYTYTAGSSPETLYVSASTSISAVTEGGVSILPVATAANGILALQLGPNEAVVITYTGTLTAKKMVH